DRAMRAWEAVLEIDANDMEALDALAQLHAAAESFRDPADVLERKLGLLELPAHRRMLRLQLAQLYDQQLTEPDQAVTHLRAVLEDSPNDPEALALLDTIFAREERHADLLE